jgi:hypothetical protein
VTTPWLILLLLSVAFNAALAIAVLWLKRNVRTLWRIVTATDTARVYWMGVALKNFAASKPPPSEPPDFYNNPDWWKQ